MALSNGFYTKPDKLHQLKVLIDNIGAVTFYEDQIRVNEKILEILGDLKSEQDSHAPI